MKKQQVNLSSDVSDNEAGALSGIRVLDLSRLLPGPYCSMVLADHGAEVIAVEDRRYLKDDLYFEDVYRNKRHMTLNLKSDRGRTILKALLKTVDIVIEGFRPGVAARLGVDYTSVCRINPAVIYCSISGYGQDGPCRDEVGHDINYISRAGILDLIGEKNRRPVIPAVQIADIAGGSMNAVSGILLALYSREKTGKGQHVDISMTDGMLSFLAMPYFLQKKKGMIQHRSETMFSHRYACYNTYETADGRYLAVGAVERRFWVNVCQLLGMEHFVELQYDEENREKVISEFSRMFREHSLEHWQHVFAGKDVCVSAIQTFDEVLVDPLFAERGMVIESEVDHRGEKSFGIPIKLSATPGSIRTQPPGFGDSTRTILQELGYDETAIDEMFADGVI